MSPKWRFLLGSNNLENEFANTQKYVAFDMCNKDTYSIEYLKLFQAVCSELDVLGKEILHHFEPDFKVGGNETIIHWGFGVSQYLRSSLGATVIFADKIQLTPWAKFGYERYSKKVKNKKDAVCYRLEDGCEKPKWWNEYNLVKHARTTCDEDGRVNYQRANFGNLLHAFAALFILEQYYMGVLMQEAKTYYPTRESRLFKLQYADLDPDMEIKEELAGAV